MSATQAAETEQSMWKSSARSKDLTDALELGWQHVGAICCPFIGTGVALAHLHPDFAENRI